MSISTSGYSQKERSKRIAQWKLINIQNDNRNCKIHKLFYFLRDQFQTLPSQWLHVNAPWCQIIELHSSWNRILSAGHYNGQHGDCSLQTNWHLDLSLRRTLHTSTTTTQKQTKRMGKNYQNGTYPLIGNIFAEWKHDPPKWDSTCWMRTRQTKHHHIAHRYLIPE